MLPHSFSLCLSLHSSLSASLSLLSLSLPLSLPYLSDRQWWIEECEASRCQLFPGIDLPKHYKKSIDDDEEELIG